MTEDKSNEEKKDKKIQRPKPDRDIVIDLQKAKRPKPDRDLVAYLAEEMPNVDSSKTMNESKRAKEKGRIKKDSADNNGEKKTEN